MATLAISVATVWSLGLTSPLWAVIAAGLAAGLVLHVIMLILSKAN